MIKFKYLVDIASILNTHGEVLDLNLVKQIESKYHCRKRFELGFYLVDKILGVRINDFKTHYDFKISEYKYCLQTPLVINFFNVTNPAFIKRYLKLQDNFPQQLKFLLRSFLHFFLPTDNDLNAFKIKLPVFVLAIVRPFRLAAKAISQILSKTAANNSD